MKFSFKHNYLPRGTLLFAAAVLLLLSFGSSYYFAAKPSVKNEQKKLQDYLFKIQSDYESLLSDRVLMRKLVQQNESLGEFKWVAKKGYGLFAFVEIISGQYQLLFWNNQKILPPDADYNMADGEYFQRLANGYYVVVKKTIRLEGMSNNVIAYAMIPVLYQYEIETDYLLTHFAYDKEAINKISVSEAKTDFPIHALHKKNLFYINKKAHAATGPNDPVTATLRWLAFVLILAYVHFVAETFSTQKRITYAVLFLLSR